jgi:hypothetical protein
MVGHQTEAIYRRYAIADEAILCEGPRTCPRFIRCNTMSLFDPVEPREPKGKARRIDYPSRFSRSNFHTLKH